MCERRILHTKKKVEVKQVKKKMCNYFSCRASSRWAFFFSASTSSEPAVNVEMRAARSACFAFSAKMGSSSICCSPNLRDARCGSRRATNVVYVYIKRKHTKRQRHRNTLARVKLYINVCVKWEYFFVFFFTHKNDL